LLLLFILIIIHFIAFAFTFTHAKHQPTQFILWKQQEKQQKVQNWCKKG